MKNSSSSSWCGTPGSIVPSRFLQAFGVVFTLVLGSTVVRAQQIQVTPSDTTVFSFAGYEGGPFLPETATEWNLDNADARDADYTVQSDQLWLKVEPTSGKVGGLFTRNVKVSATLNVDHAKALAPGIYTAKVSFANITNGDGNTSRTVKLKVAPANFSATPAFLSTSATLNGLNPGDLSVTLRGNGQPDLNYSLDWDEKSWFTVDRTGGTVPGNGTTSFKVSFNIQGLVPDTYTAQIDVTNSTNGAGTRQIPVTLTVKAKGAGAVVLLPNEDIDIFGPVGNLPVTMQRSNLINDGEKSVSWNAVVSAPWVSVTPSAGDLGISDGLAGGFDERNVDIRVNVAAQALPAGTSTATVTFQTITTNLVNGTVTGVPFGTRIVQVVANPVLTLSSPAVGGTVSTDPPGALLDNGASSTRRISFEFGEVVVVTATPGDGYEFRGWAGDFPEDAETTNPIILAMDASKKLGALIAPILRELTLSTAGAGSGTIDMTPTGVEIENALSARYTNGTTVTLTADADAGSVFRGWSGNVPPGQELTNPLTVMMDRERVISARFEPTITFEVQVIGNGAVDVNPDLPAYAAGMTVILTAIPDPTFVFTGWGGDGSGATDTLTLTIGGDTVVTATFAVEASGGGDGGSGNGNTAKLFVDILGDGVVTPEGGTYAKGAEVTLIATPGLNSTFVRWEQDAGGTELITTIQMASDRTVRAVFEPLDDSTGRPNDSPTVPVCGATGFLGLSSMLVGWLTLAGWTRRR